MSKYTCSLCQKSFAQKIDFTRHTKEKKTPCVSLEKIQEIQQLEQTTVNSKTTREGKVTGLKQKLDNCHNLLRDREGVTGEKALRNIGFVVILKMLERFINQGDPMGLLTHNYDFSAYEVSEEDQQKIVNYVRFGELKEVNEEKFVSHIGLVWEIILAQNPFTRKIFRRGKGFDISKGSTFVALFAKINELDTDDEMGDLLGDAYELFIKDIMKGKTLGQFFTPLQVRRKLVKLLCPQVRPDGTIPSCCDPTMGTCGLLLTYLNSLKTDATNRGIALDWNQIQHAIYGRELEPDTFQLGMSNMLVSTGYIFDDFECGDSIRDPINRKFDYIIANPPFGIKGLKYADITNASGLKGAYIPIKTDNAVSLFLQAIIYMLNIGGTCAVVLPDGQDLFSKSGAYVQVREYLMKTCDLKGVYYLPSGIFETTSIKTCIFHFVKRREGSEVLVQPDEEPAEIGGKKKKAKKVKTDSIFSTKTHQTTKVRFYDHTPGAKDDRESEGTDSLFAEVAIEDIAANSYSLNYTEYMKEEENEEQEAIDERNGVVVKTLGEVCDFQNGYSFKSNDYAKQNGTNIGILQIKSIQNGNIDTNKITEYIPENTKYKLFEIQKGDILIALSGATTGKIGIYNLDQKSYLNQRVGKIIAKPGTSQKYIYYWYVCCNIDEMILNSAHGTAQPNISTNDISKLKIQIPSLERQQEIVEYLDFVYEKANKTNIEKIAELKQLNAYRLKHQQTFGDNSMKTLGEVCTFDIGGTPARNNSKYYENGNNLWASVRELNGGYIYDTKEKITDVGVKNSSVKLFDAGTVLFSFKLSIGKTAIVGSPLYTNEAIAGFVSKDQNVLINKYLYTYLTISDFTKMGVGILGNGSLNKKSLAQLKISIPSLERQQEIVAYCKQNDERIKQLEQEIEQNKQLATAFIADVLSSNGASSYSVSDESEHDNEFEETNEKDAEESA